MFKSSAGELKKLKVITAAALLIALHTILSFLSITISNSLRISISFIANCIIGLYFGPVVGFICGGLGDVVSYLVKPTGAFFPGWTLSAALAGMSYGIAFYKKYPKLLTGDKEAVVKDKSNVKDNGNKLIKKINYNFFTQAAALSCVFIWLFAPVMSLKDLAEGSEKGNMIFNKKSGFDIIFHYEGEVNHTVFLLLIFLIIVFFVLIYAETLKNKLIPAQISLYTACIATLTIYEYRKKAVVPEIGFFLILCLLLLAAIINIIIVFNEKNIDMAYLLRCFIVMAFVAVIINGILGTYWCTIMYGNKFMVYFIPRIAKNIFQLPINTMITYIVIKKIKNKLLYTC